jgi:hypothetical protein
MYMLENAKLKHATQAKQHFKDKRTLFFKECGVATAYLRSTMNEKLLNSNFCSGAASVSAMQHFKNILFVTYWYDYY